MIKYYQKKNIKCLLSLRSKKEMDLIKIKLKKLQEKLKILRLLA